MRTFSKQSPIPAVPAAARIDIRYGGQVSQVERESVQIAEAYISTLGHERSVLYLNTLSPELEMSYKIREATKRLRSNVRAERFKYMSVEPDEIYAKREMIEEMVCEFRVRVIILNSFDFASLTPRGRRRVFQFLKYLRDYMRMHIIIYARNEPKMEMLGVFGELAWLSASVSAINNPVLVAVKRNKTVTGSQTVVSETGLEKIDVVHQVEYLSVEPEDASIEPLVVPLTPYGSADHVLREIGLEMTQLTPDAPTLVTEPVDETESEVAATETAKDNNVLLGNKDLEGAEVHTQTPTEEGDHDFVGEEEEDYEPALR